MMKKVLLSVAVVAILMPSMALAISLEATYDSWIREVDASDVNYRDNDLVSVAAGSSAYGVRYGVIEFDLSSIGVPITSAHLQLWNQINGSDDDLRGYDQNATLIDGTWVNPAGGGASGVGLLDWTGINTALAGGTFMTALGTISGPAHVGAGTYVNSTASVGDIAALEADRASDDLATFVFVMNEGVDSRNSWGDRDGSVAGTLAARLTINEPPVPDPIPPFELSQAIWARSDSSYLNDGVIVTNDPGHTAGAPTVGLMQWDLSHPSLGDPANLIGATLELFASPNEVRNVNPGQIAFQIDLNGTPLELTSDEPSYTAEYGGQGNALEGLGVVPDTTPTLLDGDSVLTVASAADLQLIRDVMNGNQILTMEFRADGSSTGQYWGDGHYGIAPILTLTFIPEPSAVMIAALTLISLIGFLRHR